VTDGWDNVGALSQDDSADRAEVLTAELDATAAGSRLDAALAAALTALSRTRIRALLEAGAVTDRGTGQPLTQPKARVAGPMRLAVRVPAPVAAHPKPEPIPLDVRYEDEAIIIINKPAGMVVHPAPGHPGGTLVNALLHHCGDSLSGIGGVSRPGIVHRLDRDTSGLMVAAKRDQVHQKLAAQFADRSLSRSYRALCWGAPNARKGVLDWPIGRHPVDRQRMAIRREGVGKEARTHYQVLQVFADGRPKASRPFCAALLSCTLETGRTHQIRVHLTALGYPIIGDSVYGGGITGARRASVSPAALALIEGLSGQALHASTLSLVHPVSGELMHLEAPLPLEMERLVAMLSSGFRGEL
jgi:23S rRNA pseudouridine1911/1915/1917 synthase